MLVELKFDNKMSLLSGNRLYGNTRPFCFVTYHSNISLQGHICVILSTTELSPLKISRTKTFSMKNILKLNKTYSL